MTDRAQGAALAREARFKFPASLRASMYFMSPAWPLAIHWGKNWCSEVSLTPATPARSNPASVASRLISLLRWRWLGTLIYRGFALIIRAGWIVAALAALPL